MAEDAVSKDKWFMPALRTVFDISFFLYGMYRETGAAIICGFLLVVLIAKSRNGLHVRLNAAFIAVAVMTAFYFLSAFWAVDPWLALRGAVKFLPVLLFTVCLMQGTRDDRMDILKDVPYIGAVMTVIAYVIGLFPYFSSWIWWRGRFAGLFLYPNVYACFLLIGLEMILTMAPDEHHRLRDIIMGSILFFGMLESGSRIVFMLAVPGVIIALIIRKDSRTTAVGAGSLIGGFVTDRIVTFLTGLGDAGRVLQISTGSTSLRNRLVFWKDAIPVALTHPFGFGYRGYSYIQGSVESGPYSVMVVHNSFLQIMVDIGWIPAIAAFVAVVRGFFSKHATAATRLILATLVIHSVVDFDLEFIAMYFILICLLDLDSGREIALRLPLFAEIVPSAVIYAFCAYVGIVCLFMHNYVYDTAYKLCPWDTESEVRIMAETGDMEEKARLAGDILSRNRYVAEAWAVLAQSAYDDGDVSSYIEYQREAISLEHYNTDRYADYFYGLRALYDGYEADGDIDGMSLCLSEIKNIGVMLEELEAGTDSLMLGRDDSSDFTMPEEYYEFLEKLDI